MRRLSLAQWCASLERSIAQVRPEAQAALAEIGATATKRAKEKIGHYQSAEGPFPAWPPLAPSTVAEKERLGYAPPDNPLLRTGEMRDSISYTVAPLAVAVGSASPIMRYQEGGTATIPPRPVIGPAMLETDPLAKRRLGAALGRALTGRRR